MAEEWNAYLSYVNNKPASVLIDLGLRAEAPLVSKPWLFWVWVYMNDPRSDGLHDGKEAPRLSAIADALTAEMALNCGAILGGRISTERRWELYFYGEAREEFEQTVSSTLRKFPDYRFDFGNQQDRLWEQYLNVLYPSDEEVQRIKNREVLDVLVERGDVLTVPRQVQHWMYFSSAEARTGFRNLAAIAGFSTFVDLNPAQGRSEDGLPFGLRISHRQAIEQALIDKTVIELFRLTRRFAGEYDGWETRVITQ
jgi:uncharacterized protein (TIGR01619 family)